MENKKTRCIFIHQWDKWKELEPVSSGEHITIKQIRYCKLCNKGQGRSVTYVKKVR